MIGLLTNCVAENSHPWLFLYLHNLVLVLLSSWIFHQTRKGDRTGAPCSIQFLVWIPLDLGCDVACKGHQVWMQVAMQEMERKIDYGCDFCLFSGGGLSSTSSSARALISTFLLVIWLMLCTTHCILVHFICCFLSRWNFILAGRWLC